MRFPGGLYEARHPQGGLGSMSGSPQFVCLHQDAGQHKGHIEVSRLAILLIRVPINT